MIKQIVVISLFACSLQTFAENAPVAKLNVGDQVKIVILKTPVSSCPAGSAMLVDDHGMIQQGSPCLNPTDAAPQVVPKPTP